MLVVMVHNIKFKNKEVHKYTWHKDLYGTGSSKCVTVSADLLSCRNWALEKG